MEIQFLPLDLWRASSLAQETKTVVAAFERCLASGDAEGLDALRRAIEKRIDDLEAFYMAHVEDERSVLFEKQRLKLRRLLHDYDAAVPGASGKVSGAPSGLSADASAAYSSAAATGGAGLSSLSSSTAGPAGSSPYWATGAADAASASATGAATVITREIREDTRLTQAELLAWFTQAGVSEMPEVSPDAVSRVFANFTRTNLDGKMSVRDLRQWYITFGKRALREGIPLDGKEIVSLALVKTVTAAAVTARKEDAVLRRNPLEVLTAAVAGGSGSGGAGASSGGAGGLGATMGSAAGGGDARKPLYAWESGAAAAAAGGATIAGLPTPGSSASAPLGLGATGRSDAGHVPYGGLPSPTSGMGGGPIVLPNGMLEFQVRLTPDDYAQLQLRKRQMEAEAKYRQRIAAAKDKAQHLKGAPLPGYLGPAALAAALAAAEASAKEAAATAVPLHYGQTSLITTGPYEEPTGANTYFYRSP